MRRILTTAALLAVAAGAFVATRSDAPRPPGESAVETPEPAPSGGAAPAESLLLSRRTELVRVDVASGDRHVLGEMPTAGVYAAPVTRWIAYVTSGPEDDDFAAAPELFLYDPVTERATSAGPGLAPVWDAGGTRLAFLRPVEPRDCSGEECRGAVTIGVIDPDTGREWTMLDPGLYSILGWAGDRVLVSDFEDTTRIVIAPVGGDPAFLDLTPSELWEASPDGRWVLATRGDTTELLSLDGKTLGARRVAIDLAGRTLLEARWSPDSTRVAALAIPEGSRVAHEIVLFSPDAPMAAPVEGTRGALSGVVWSPDGASIAYTGTEPPRGRRLTAVVCDLGREDPCEPVLSWRAGVTIHRFE